MTNIPYRPESKNVKIKNIQNYDLPFYLHVYQNLCYTKAVIPKFRSRPKSGSRKSDIGVARWFYGEHDNYENNQNLYLNSNIMIEKI